MRRVRTVVAATALGFAALTIAVPAAHAESHSSDSSSNSSGSSESSGSEKSWPGGDGSSWEEKQQSGDHKKSPHGGPHAGIGFLDEGAGMATGGVLIAGGLGLGVYALRRRPAAGLAGA